MYSSKINSKGGLLNPSYFQSLEGKALPVRFESNLEIEINQDSGTQNSNNEKKYISILFPIKYQHPNHGLISFKVRAYVNQLVEFIKKAEKNEITEETVFYLKLEHLFGYSWLKPHIYYDKELTKEIGENTTNEDVFQYYKNKPTNERQVEGEKTVEDSKPIIEETDDFDFEEDYRDEEDYNSNDDYDDFYDATDGQLGNMGDMGWTYLGRD